MGFPRSHHIYIKRHPVMYIITNFNSNIFIDSFCKIYYLITVPPDPTTVDDGPLDITVVYGRSVNLPCEISGYPPPTITWTKNNRPLPRTLNYREHGIGSLEIYRAHIMDSGNYTCTAVNVAGNSTKTYRLLVFSKYFSAVPSKNVVSANIKHSRYSH